jgi:hypothetical protein
MVKNTKKKEPVEGEVVGEKAQEAATQATAQPAKPINASMSPEDRVEAQEEFKEIAKRGQVVVDSVIAGLAMTTGQLQTALQAQTEQRALISDFVKKHLVKGTDYIRIHVVRGCPAEDKARGSCRNKYHFSKDVLAKPGQEKIFSLFQLTSELIQDEETLKMLDGTRNLVAYKCIVKRGDKIVAEGRGAAIVGDNRRDVNATIKIAEKRARMDACLSLGFSEYFAQDLDDPDYKMQRDAAQEEAANRHETVQDDGSGLPPRPKNSPINEQERTVLARWMLKRGINDPKDQIEILRINGVEDPKKMTSGQARAIMVILKNSGDAMPADTPPAKPDEVVTDIDAVDPAAAMDETTAKPATPDPELVVDDDFKSELKARVEQLGLNERGLMWFMKKAAGKPWAKWEELEDKHWRRAYDLWSDVTEQRVPVADEHVKGFIENVKTDPGPEKESEA